MHIIMSQLIVEEKDQQLVENQHLQLYGRPNKVILFYVTVPKRLAR